MSVRGPKAESVTVEGKPDGWKPELGYTGEMDPAGSTRLVISTPHTELSRVHRALAAVLQEPVGILYRQKVDRKDPKPQGAPPRDFVAVHMPAEQIRSALEAHQPLLYHDARAEIWLRGAMGEQVVMDQDGVIFCYPDDPSFRDALEASGVPERAIQTMADRDYVKHWFHAACDAHEAGLMQDLGLQEVPHRKG